jgi:phosphoglycerate dehydrogenase-like enzyme
MKGCFVCKEGGRFPYVFGQGRMEIIRNEIEICEDFIHQANIERHREFLKDVECVFGTWDMEEFSKEQIKEYFPNLKIVFYAAASVQYFARPYLENGVQVLSAYKRMAIPVAQFTVAMITLANKGALLAMDAYKKKGYGPAQQITHHHFPGSYKTKVGILGAGTIGSLVIQMLKENQLEVLVYDPFLSDESAKELGVTKRSLEEIFTECQVISNHLADKKEIIGILNYDLFSRMKDQAAFINTGRGRQVVEHDLAKALREKPLRSAVLDVTYPEPLKEDHEFLKMDNVFLTPHIAGYARDEVLLFSDFMIEQLRKYMNGEKIDDCQITLEQLAVMA